MVSFPVRCPVSSVGPGLGTSEAKPSLKYKPRVLFVKNKTLRGTGGVAGDADDRKEKGRVLEKGAGERREAPGGRKPHIPGRRTGAPREQQPGRKPATKTKPAQDGSWEPAFTGLGSRSHLRTLCKGFLSRQSRLLSLRHESQRCSVIGSKPWAPRQ